MALFGSIPPCRNVSVEKLEEISIPNIADRIIILMSIDAFKNLVFH